MLRGVVAGPSDAESKSGGSNVAHSCFCEASEGVGDGASSSKRAALSDLQTEIYAESFKCGDGPSVGGVEGTLCLCRLFTGVLDTVEMSGGRGSASMLAAACSAASASSARVGALGSGDECEARVLRLKIVGLMSFAREMGGLLTSCTP